MGMKDIKNSSLYKEAAIAASRLELWISKVDGVEDFSLWVSNLHPSHPSENNDTQQSAQIFLKALAYLIAIPALFIRDLFRLPLNIYRIVKGYAMVKVEDLTHEPNDLDMWRYGNKYYQNHQAHIKWPGLKVRPRKQKTIVKAIFTPFWTLILNLLDAASTVAIEFFAVPLKTFNQLIFHVDNLIRANALKEDSSGVTEISRMESLVMVLGVAVIVVGLYFLAPVMIAAIAGYFAMPTVTSFTAAGIAAAATSGYTISLEIMACAIVCLITVGNTAMAGLGLIVDKMFPGKPAKTATETTEPTQVNSSSFKTDAPESAPPDSHNAPDLATHEATTNSHPTARTPNDPAKHN